MLKNDERNLETILNVYPIELHLVRNHKDEALNGYDLPEFKFPNGFQIKSEAHAKALALGLHKSIVEGLEVAEKSGASVEKTEPLKQWSYKKALSHTAEVSYYAKAIAKSPEFSGPFQQNGADMDYVMKTVRANSWLHDIGRQGEIDFKGLQTVELGKARGKNMDHSFESFKILQAAGVTDPNILLPVRYHGMLKYKDALATDPIFAGLSEQQQGDAVRFIDVLRDADKVANLVSKSKNGMKGVGELTNPKYSGDYDITPATLDGLVNGTGCDTKVESHYLDAMLRWLSWGDQVVYPVPSVEKLIGKLWGRTFEEAESEFNTSCDKDETRYAKTVNALTHAREIQMSRLKTGKTAYSEK